jgi:hypothetical protein
MSILTSHLVFLVQRIVLCESQYRLCILKKRREVLIMPPLALDYRHIYHMPEVSSRSGPVTVKDTHSPGGNRNTEVYTAQAWDCTGALTLFEIWCIHCNKGDQYFRFVRNT